MPGRGGRGEQKSAGDWWAWADGEEDVNEPCERTFLGASRRWYSSCGSSFAHPPAHPPIRRERMALLNEPGRDAARRKKGRSCVLRVCLHNASGVILETHTDLSVLDGPKGPGVTASELVPPLNAPTADRLRMAGCWSLCDAALTSPHFASLNSSSR